MAQTTVVTYELTYIPVEELWVAGEYSSYDYPEATGTFSTSDGVVQNEDVLSLASPTSTFTLSTYPYRMTLPDVGKYILVKGKIYQITAESRASSKRQQIGGWSSEATYDTSIYIYKLNQVIVTISSETIIDKSTALVESAQRIILRGTALVNGTGHEVSRGRSLVDGTGRNISLTPATVPPNEIPVGSSLFGNVNGVRTEFIVVHQGNPDPSMYDASCDGTWVMAKDCSGSGVWSSSSITNYKNSGVHSYLNSTYLDSLDSDLKSSIKEVIIPYALATKKQLSSVSAHIFLLSGYEINATGRNMTKDGAPLAYFSGDGNIDSNRIAKYDGTARKWWLRSPLYDIDEDFIHYVSTSGTVGNFMYTEPNSSGLYYRPAFILKSDATINPHTFDIVG